MITVGGAADDEFPRDRQIALLQQVVDIGVIAGFPRDGLLQLAGHGKSAAERLEALQVEALRFILVEYAGQAGALGDRIETI